MKIYVHYEGSVGPAFTVAQQVDDKLTTVKDAVAVFVGQYNAAQQTHVLDAHTQLYNADGQLLQQMAALSSLVEDREDVFVKGAVTAKTSSAKSAAPIPKTTPAPAPAPTPAPASTPKMAAPTVTVTAGVLEDLITQRNLRKARVLCEEALRVTNPRLPAHEIHWFLARISLLSDAQRNHAAAERYASQALSAGKRCTGVDTARYSLTLARAMYEAGDKYDEAEEVLSDLLHTYGSRRSVHILDARVLKAECLFELGKHEEAAGLLNDHMQWPGAEEHIPTLIAYARFAMRYKKVEEPVRALLKAIVADQKNKKCRAMLAELLSTEAGYAEFQRQVPSATGSAAAYAFLATAVKDCSAMPASIKLLSAALRVENEKSSSNKAASYALNLSHAHEIVYDFKNAFLVLVDFCKEHRTLRVGRRGYSCAELLQALTGGAAVGATAAAQLPLSAPPESERETYADHDIDLLAIGFAAVKVAYLRGQFSLLPGLYRVCEPTRLASKTPLHETAIRNEAAYYQCVFQTLDARKVSPDVRLTPFAGVPTAGELVTKPLSLPVCEPLWSHQLPATADPVLYLNNPAASSAQAGVPFEERVVTPALLAAAAASPVYICGDSHCLSPAWSVVYAPVGGVPPADTQAVKAAAAKAPPPTAEAGTAESGGGAGALVPRLLVPRLVTGVKQWHLRPDSSFYPKANFHHAVKNIPDGADVSRSDSGRGTGMRFAPDVCLLWCGLCGVVWCGVWLVRGVVYNASQCIISYPSPRCALVRPLIHSLPSVC